MLELTVKMQQFPVVPHLKPPPLSAHYPHQLYQLCGRNHPKAIQPICQYHLKKLWRYKNCYFFLQNPKNLLLQYESHIYQFPKYFQAHSLAH